MLLEVEAEQVQRVAALSKLLFWVPGGRARGEPVPLLPHHAPACAAQSTQERRRGGRAARLRWERSLSVRQPPLLCHLSLNVTPVLFCVSPGRFSSKSLLLRVQSAIQILAG